MKTRFMSVLAAAFVALICGSAQAWTITTNGATRTVSMKVGETAVDSWAHNEPRWLELYNADGDATIAQPAFTPSAQSSTRVSALCTGDQQTFAFTGLRGGKTSWMLYTCSQLDDFEPDYEGTTSGSNRYPYRKYSGHTSDGNYWSGPKVTYDITVDPLLTVTATDEHLSSYIVSNETTHAEIPATEPGVYSVPYGNSVKVYLIPSEGWEIKTGNPINVDEVTEDETVDTFPTVSRIELTLTMPKTIEHATYVVWNETENKPVPETWSGANRVRYKVLYGDTVKVYLIPETGWRIRTGNPVDLGAVTADMTVNADDLPTAEPIEDFALYPDGDGGAFVAAKKSTDTYNGAIISSDGVEGTIQVKVKKPNRKSGLFDIQAKVVTFVDKASYSFKAKKILAPSNGVLTVELPYLNKKSAGHALTVTLDGDSLTGTFDSFRVEGARDVFAAKNAEKTAAILPFAGTYWTGVFEDEASELFGAAFSVTIKAKTGKASVKVLDADGKTMSCNAFCEIGANGVVAVPVTVRKSVKTAKGFAQRSFGFRIVFTALPDGTKICEAVDVSPMRDWVKKTDSASAAICCWPRFVTAGEVTVTAKAFKDGYATVFDPALTSEVGSVMKTSLKLAKTGFITGTVKVAVTATGKSVTSKAAGVLVGTAGAGVFNVKLSKGLTARYGFASAPAK